MNAAVLDHNRIAQKELHHLRHQLSQSRVAYLLLVPALVVVVPLIPQPNPLLVLQSTNPANAIPDPLFIGMVVASHLFFLYVLIRTAVIATYAINREFVTQNWGLLILTGVSARRIVWGKWWAVMRYLWRDYLIGALPRLALVYVVMTSYYRWQFATDSDFCTQLNGFFGPFCTRQFMFATFSANLLNVVSTAGMLAVFSLVGAAFVTALSISIVLHYRKWESAHVLMVVGNCVGIAGCLVGLLLFIAAQKFAVHGYTNTVDQAAFCDRGQVFEGLDCEQVLALRNSLRIVEAGQVALTTLVDHGLLLSVNLMQPGVTLAALARNMTSGLLGAAIFALVTWLLMWASVHRAREMGAA